LGGGPGGRRDSVTKRHKGEGGERTTKMSRVIFKQKIDYCTYYLGDSELRQQT